MDIIFEISASNYIGWQKFELCSVSLSVFCAKSIEYQGIETNGHHIRNQRIKLYRLAKKSPQTDRTSPNFQSFSISLLGPHRGQDGTRALGGARFARPRALRARREKKIQHRQCERCAR